MRIASQEKQEAMGNLLLNGTVHSFDTLYVTYKNTLVITIQNTFNTIVTMFMAMKIMSHLLFSSGAKHPSMSENCLQQRDEDHLSSREALFACFCV